MNLRRGLLLGLSVALVLSMALVANGIVPGWWLLVNSAILLLSLLFERRGYHPRAPDPTALLATGERFHDPTTGELLEVWEDPRNGAREYRPVSES